MLTACRKEAIFRLSATNVNVKNRGRKAWHCLFQGVAILLFSLTSLAVHGQALVEYDIRNLTWNGSPLAATTVDANVEAGDITVTGPAAFDNDFWAGSSQNMFLTGWAGSQNMSQDYYEFTVSAASGYELNLDNVAVGVANENDITDSVNEFRGPITFRLYASVNGFGINDYIAEVAIPHESGGVIRQRILSAALGAAFKGITSATFRVYAFGDVGASGAGGIANFSGDFTHSSTEFSPVIASETSNVIISGTSTTVPDAPTNVQATAGDAQASVAFDAPASNGGAAITSYTVTSSPGGLTQSGGSSPIVVTGLTNGDAYTFSVTATNPTGTGAASTASSAVTPMGAQTITFANPGAQDFATSPTLTATASSGLTVSFSSTTAGVCTITAGGALTLVAPGTCTINANQAGNPEFNPAPQVAQTFQVNAVLPGAPEIGTATLSSAEATVTFTPPAFTGGAAITGYTVTSSPGNITASGTGSPITVTGLGNGTSYTFTVTATNSAGTGPASAASNSVTPTVTQTITFADPGNQDFGTSPQLAASVNSPLDVEYSTDTPAVCTVTTGGVLTFVATGNCTIHADQPGASGYEPAPRVTQTFAVNAVVPGAPTAVTAVAGDQQATVSFSPPAFDGGASITGYTVTSNPGGFTGTGAASPITVSGLSNGTSYTFSVTATNAAGSSAASAASTSVVPRSAQTITFAQPADQDFGTTPQLGATASSGLTVVFSSTTPAVCTVTTAGLLGFVSAGSCEIDADQSGDAAWLAATTVTRSFEVLAVAPGAPTIGSATAGDAEATVTFTAPGFEGGSAITQYTVTASPGGLTGTGVASPITVGGLTNGTSYTFAVTAANGIGSGAASAASNAVVPKADQVITFGNPGVQNYHETPTLSATSDSGLAVVFTADAGSSAVCDITTGGTLNFLDVGNCTIHANQPGSSAFNAATQVSRTFTVEQVNRAPELTVVATVTYVQGAAPQKLDASAAVADPDLDALNAGDGNYTGASLVIARDGGANADDLFSLVGVGSLTVAGGPDGGGSVSVGGDIIAVIADTGEGQLQLSFQNNGTIATRALVNETLRAVHYAKVNSSPTGSFVMVWTFNDGNSVADEQGTGGARDDAASQTVNVQLPQPADQGNVVSTQTSVNHTSGTLTITAGGVVTGGTLGGTVVNNGTIGGNITLLANVTVSGGTISGRLTGDPEQPALINGGNITAGAELSNVVIGADTVLEPGVELGPNVKFESEASIPPSMDLTRALKSVPWGTGDEFQLVDMSDDVLAGSENQPPVPLINFVQLMQGLAQSDVDVTQNGEIEVITDDFRSLVLPVSVSQADPDTPEGVYFNDDGDIVLITESRRVVVAYPALINESAFLAALNAQGLQLQYDTRANLVVGAGNDQQSLMDGGPNILSLASNQYYSGRPEVMAVPAHRGTVPGLVDYPIAGLGNVGGISLIFENGEGDLMEQDIVPVPLDSKALREAIANIDGVTSVRIGTDGVIVASVDGVAIRGRVDYVVYRAAGSQRDELGLRLVGDISGNGLSDYEITYTNGDQQILFIYPVE